jgi:glutamyl-tRNA reductase
MVENSNTLSFLPGRVLVIGANHRSSSMILRDRLFVEEEAEPLILERLKEAGIDQALVLSTCDRVEVQAFCEDDSIDGDELVSRIIKILAHHGELEPSELDGQTYVHWAEQAVRQIFAVTSSLDSLIVGEPQVLGQVKASHRIAKAAGMTSSSLESILQAAYATAKRVRNETAIGERPVSIAAAATQLAGDLHGDLKKCSVLLVGGGEIGELIASDMLSTGLGKLVTIHPSERRAEESAKRLDCHTGAFEDIPSLLIEADIVLASLGRRRYAISADIVNRAIAARRHKPVFLIDAAIPGDIDPLVERIEDAFLYSMDDLERVAMEGRAGRENESGAAWKIVDGEVDALLRGHAERTAVPALNRLRTHFDAMREQALADSGDDAEKATRLLINRLLHAPSEALRELAADTDDWREMENNIDRLFGLDDDEKI